MPGFKGATDCGSDLGREEDSLRCGFRSTAERGTTGASRHWKLLWLLPAAAALACGGDHGPPPSVRLFIRGQILSADPTPAAIPRATVALYHFQGFLGNPQIAARTTADHVGHYELQYTFTSICEPSDQPGYWIEASAEGYETRSTFTFENQYSDPPIYCTSAPQVINLTLQPFGVLRVITSTSGSGLDPDGYTLLFEGTLGYLLELNDDQLLPPLRPGQYSLELTEVSGNCSVTGENPRTVTVAARDTTVSTFEVSCVS